MSGRKDWEYRLARERQAKLDLVRQIERRRSEVAALREHVAAALEGASEGLRATFRNESEQARQWLRQGGNRPEAAVDAGKDLPALREVLAQTDRDAAEGRRVQEALSVALTRKADALGRRLAQVLAQAEQACLGASDLARLWHGEAVVGRWEQELVRARQLLAHEQYAAVEPLLAALRADVEAKTRSAEEQEEKHQRRMYLVKALRQVCADLGFEEVGSPRFEHEGQRGSAIRLTFDTLDRGQIQFTVALDGVRSDSELVQRHCAEEVSALADRLEEEFGIQTTIKTADGQPVPRLLRKGERDLPGDASRQAAAGS
jgi:hypothetical protein